MADLQKFIDRMVYWTRDANLGYNQLDRWNFNPAAGNSDCSSLVIHCLKEAGFDTGSSTYTGNMSANLTARGWVRLPNNGHPQPGDILLNDVHHVAVYIGNGLLAQSSVSEHGTAYGSAGDQTGRETNIKPYYNYPWDCYLRWNGDDVVTKQDIDAIAAAVVNYNLNGTLLRDRIIGTDLAANRAANGADTINKTLTGGNNEFRWLCDRVYRIANLLFNRKDNAGSGMVDTQGHDIERPIYDRVVWIDKRLRELNTHTTGEPQEIRDLNTRMDAIEQKLDQLIAAKGDTKNE